MQPTKWAEFSTTHLKCRALRHAWEPTETVVSTMDRRAVLEVHLACTRCGLGRIDIIARRDGERMVHPRYRYPDDYLVRDRKSWGDRATFNANTRRELYERFVPKKVS